MSHTVPQAMAVLREEVAKVPAFFRRDLMILLSYRAALLSDWVNLLVQVVIFAYVSRLVDPATLPAYGAGPTSYLEFVVIGIAIGAFVQLGLTRLVAVFRAERVMGTLEALLLTPTAFTTLQLGSVAYELVYVPVRTALFLAAVAAAFGLSLQLSGLGPVLVALLLFIPTIWGLGVASAGLVLVFRRGSGAAGFVGTILAVGSGAYFPLELFPSWLQTALQANPVAIMLEVARQALLGGAGWAELGPRILLLVPMSVFALAAGIGIFRLALERELRAGTLHLY